MNLENQVLEQITKERIKPTPKWIFLAKNYSLWILAASSIVFGGVAAALVILMMRENDWDLFPHLGRGFLGFLLLSIPYVWVLIFGLLVVVIYFELRKTKTGYQYNSLLIVGVSIITCLLIGFLVHLVGIGPRIGHNLGRMPGYQKMFFHRNQLWDHPENGIVAGRVIKVKNIKDFQLEAINGRGWHVLAGESYDVSPANLEIVEGAMIKAIGEKIDEEVFEASQIRPLQGPRPRPIPVLLPPVVNERNN